VGQVSSILYHELRKYVVYELKKDKGFLLLNRSGF